MILNNNFAVFILTHGRPNNVITYSTLLKQGYTGKIYLIIDNEDKTASKYYDIYGPDKVIMFNKLEIAKSFDHSAVIGDWMPFENQKFMNSSFYLNLNGSQKQAGSPKDLIFGLEKLIEYISSIFTIQKGDLLFTGTPSGVGPVKIGDKLEGYLDDIKVLHCDIK